MRLFIALGTAGIATIGAAATLAALIAQPSKPPPSKPVLLAAAAPLVPKLVPTEAYTRPAPAAPAAAVAAPAVPVRVILANPYAVVAGAAPIAPMAKAEPPAAAAPRADPRFREEPWAEEIAKEPRRRVDRERERRAEAAGEDHGICARHRLRKVWVSDRRWRCRK